MEQPKAKENTNAKIPIYLIIKNALSKDFFFPYFSRTRTHGICGYMDATLLREERRNSVRMTCHYPGNEVDLGFLLDEANFQLMRHNLDLRSDTSSVWNFCAFSLDVISRGNQR